MRKHFDVFLSLFQGKFNVVDVEPKKLIIAFEVSFDFLPTFTEYISMDQI